jgi:hypothetical protein
MNTSTPASSAADTLVAPATSAFVVGDSGAGEAALWDIWTNVVEYASQTPAHELDRVVEIIAAVAELKEPAAFEIWGKQTAWKELPLLGPVIRESWDDGMSLYLAFSSNSKARRKSWLANFLSERHTEPFNINAFAARLTAAGLVDLSIYAIWTLRLVLEDSAPSQIYDRRGDEGCKAAAAWFIYAGKVLYAYCNEEKTYSGRAAMQGSDVVGEDWSGYNQGRWRLWVERLEEVQKAVVDEETKKVLQNAVETIRNVST